MKNIPSINKLTKEEILMVLKQEAEKNPASMAAFLVFCDRERPRSTLTLVGLEHRMKNAGYKYSKSDYEPFIRVLANMGFGNLDLGKNGKLLGLKDVNTDFSSIGNMVCGKGSGFKSFKTRAKFARFTVPNPLSPMRSLSDNPGLKIRSEKFEMSLDIVINGKHVTIPVPKDLTNEDVAALVGRFKEA